MLRIKPQRTLVVFSSKSSEVSRTNFQFQYETKLKSFLTIDNGLRRLVEMPANILHNVHTYGSFADFDGVDCTLC